MTIKKIKNLLRAVGIAIFYDIAIALQRTIHKLNIEMGRSIALSLTSVTRTIAPTQVKA